MFRPAATAWPAITEKTLTALPLWQRRADKNHTQNNKVAIGSTLEEKTMTIKSKLISTIATAAFIAATGTASADGVLRLG